MSGDLQSRTAASVRARLLNLSKNQEEAFDLTLTRYALERFLYRLSHTQHRSSLILKGAMLFQVWSPTTHRSTRDLDLLAEGDTSIASITQRIIEITSQEVEEDGLIFDTTGLVVREIREQAEYGGVRAKFEALLGTAKISIQIDFGAGDAVTPTPTEAEYPTLLDMPSPVVLMYPRETVIAEKLEAIVELGMDNSRMKDYFDLWFLSTTYQYDTELLALAVRRTFERRKQRLPIDVPVGLTDEFATNPSKQAQWTAFRTRIGGSVLTLTDVVTQVRSFTMPILLAGSDRCS